MSRKIVLLIVSTIFLTGMLTSAYNIQPVKALVTSTLLTNLEYPNGLWIKGDSTYLTETNGRNTGYGGKICLDRYNITAGQKTVLVNNPECSDAVVVASNGTIFLTSYQGSTPGESGTVSVVDPETNIETHLLNIDIASKDMFIDSNDDILIIGSSDSPSAKSIYLLPSENYTDPIVLKTGLGRTWCISKSGTYTYFSDLSAVKRFNASGTIETFVNKAVMSMSFSSKYLYYADYFGGTVGRINIQTKSDETLVSGLNEPINVRYDEASNRLYFLEAGTNSGEYKDGTLKGIEYVQPVLRTFYPEWAEKTYTVTIESNLTISNFNFNQSLAQISFNVTGPEGGTGPCNVSIPEAFMWVDVLDEWNVTINGVPLDLIERTVTYNGTHYYIHFKCNTSIITIRIISRYVVPEFQSFLLLPLFVMATLLAVLVYRRKYRAVPKGRINKPAR
jgi:hypothetical protein